LVLGELRLQQHLPAATENQLLHDLLPPEYEVLNKQSDLALSGCSLRILVGPLPLKREGGGKGDKKEEEEEWLVFNVLHKEL